MLWTPKLSERELFVLSLISILLLLIASDQSPQAVPDFGGLEEEGEDVSVICALIAVRTADRGWILELMDSNSVRLAAFCPSELMPQSYPVGTILRIKARVEMDSQPFLFIEWIEAQHRP